MSPLCSVFEPNLALSFLKSQEGQPITYKICIFSNREISSVAWGRACFPGWDLRGAWLGMPIDRKQCMEESTHNKYNR